MPSPPLELDEEARRRFEADWQRGVPADLAAYLSNPNAAANLPTLVELVSIDLEMRWKQRAAGGPVPMTIEAYVVRFPQLAADDILAELIGQEMDHRRRSGEAPTAADYAARFPNYQPHSVVCESAPASPQFRRTPQIPDCEILRQLGQGGMGVVYLARQTSLNRQVAVKTLLHAAEARPEFRQRFFHEAESVAQLQHPNIVPIYHIGREGDVPYFLMEYVAGGTLADRLKQGALPALEAAKLVETLARAMEYAHQRGIIHRDLKPANILTGTAEGETRNTESQYAWKITDFGLAKTLGLDSQMTQTGNILGTPSYMAPEQATGQHGLIATTTDVYALGAILYETLTGRPPFQTETLLGTLDEVVNREPVPPSKLRPGLSRDLETICLNCLNKDPAKRYARAELLAEDLNRYLQHRPIQARRVGTWGILVRWCRRNPGLATTLAASLLLVAAIAGFATWNVIQERNNFRNERDRAEAHLYRSLVAQAAGHLDSRGPEWWWKATESLAEASRLNTPDRNAGELRDLYVRCLGTYYYSLRVKQVWANDAGPATHVAVSPDGKLAAVARRDGTVEVRTLPAGECLHTFTGFTERISGFAFHPRLPVLYVGGQPQELHRLDLSGKEQRVIFKTPDEAHITALALHRDGERLLLGTDHGSVLALELDAEGRSGEAKTLFVGTNGITSLACSPCDDEFVVADRNNTFTCRGDDGVTERWSQKTFNPVHPLRYGPEGLRLLVIDPLGFGFGLMTIYNRIFENYQQLHDNSLCRAFFLKRGILTASYDGSLRIWGREASKPLGLWTRSASDFGPIIDADILPDESAVVALYQDGSIRLWELFEPEPRSFFGHGFQSVCCVGEGHNAFDGAAIYELPETTKTRVVKPEDKHAITIWAVASSSDGRWLASADHAGVVKIRDPQTLATVAEFHNANDLIWTAAFRPGTDWLATSDGPITIRSLTDRRTLMTLPGHAKLTTSLAFHPRQSRLVSAGRDRFIRIWNLETRTVHAEYGPMATIVNSIAINPEGTLLAAGCDDGKVLIWNWDIPANASAFPKPDREITGHTSPVRAVAFSHGGVLASGAEGGVVTLRETNPDFSKLVTLQSLTGQVRSLQFSRDDRFLLVGNYVSSAVAWDLRAVRKALADVNLDW